MKRFLVPCILGLFSVGLWCSQVAADVTLNQDNFPDEAFRSYITTWFDKDGDGVLSNREISNVKTIELPYGKQDVTSVEGIALFPNLVKLSCDGYPIESLDVSKNTALKSLIFVSPLEGPFLRELDVSRNTNLETLVIHFSPIKTLDVSKNTNLQTLDINRTRIETVDLSHNLELKKLWCDYNSLLTMLDVSKNGKLEYLSCFGNGLNELDVTCNPLLSGLGCSYNSLTSLDVSQNPALSSLECHNNDLTQVDLSGCPELVELVQQVEPVEKEGYLYYNNGSSGGNHTLSVDPGLLLIGCEQEDKFVDIDESRFPNAIFREWVSENCDLDSDGKLSQEEMADVEIIDVSNLELNGDEGFPLKGIEVFHRLRHLDCSDNISFGTFTLRENAQLRILDCSGNSNVWLNVTRNGLLEELDCSGLNYSGGTLDLLSCPRLRVLKAEGLGWERLDLSMNTKLQQLNLADCTRLEELDISSCPKLVDLVLNTSPVVSGGNLCYEQSIGGEDLLLIYPKDINLITEEEVEAVPIDSAHFPDSFFRSWVRANCDTDGNGSLSQKEIYAVKEMVVRDPTYEIIETGVTTLKGIEYFPELEKLGCDNNLITQLDVSHNPKLKNLIIIGHSPNEGLTELDLSHNSALEQIKITNSALTSLDLSRNHELTLLDLENDEFLTSLDLSENPKLESFYCIYLGLNHVNLSNCSLVRSLSCNHNQLTSLDVSGMPLLETLRCQQNNIAKLDISNNPVLLALVESQTPELINDEYYVYANGEAGGYHTLSFDIGTQLVTAAQGPAEDLMVLELPFWLMEIEDEAFRGTAVEKVILPIGVSRIGAYAFADCSKLKEIWIPDFPDIDPVAFYNHRSDFCIVTDDEELIEWAGQNGIMTKSEDSL